MTQTDTSLVGALLDRRYRVDKLLARGGMSAVYRGTDTRLGRPVAIKIMDPRFADDRSFVNRFEQEARSAAQLHHPHIVAVHDQGVDVDGDKSRTFLVMELVDGGTLRDLLDERGRLDVALALSIAEPVLTALAAAHQAGLVHRDVKPENVLIGGGGTTGTGVVKVADFGLVRAVASTGATSSSVILGTAAYLSPEQVSQGATSAQGDVYSAGILLYEMLTGSAPYDGDTALSVAYRHVNDDVPAPSRVIDGIPPALDDLVYRVTRRDVHARPADAGEFLAQMRAVRAQLGIPAVPIPVPPAPDADRVSDVETTQPALPLPSLAVNATAPVTRPAAMPGAPGPRGTMAMRLPPAPPPATPPRAQPAPPPPAAPPGPTLGSVWRHKKGRIALISGAAVLAVVLVATLFWFTSGRYISVPDVAGKDETAATKMLHDADLKTKTVKVRHDTIPPGTVVGTQPGSGEDALSGDVITILVSAGRPTVPDIQPGTTPEQAEAAIREVQLEPKREAGAEQYDSSVPKGMVVRTDPRPGTPLNTGSPVRLVLSKGAPPVPIPDVTGKSKDEAFNALRAAGFDPFDAGEEPSKDLKKGMVTRTDPPKGEFPPENQTPKRVGVWVSNTVDIDVPDVRGKRLEEAVQLLAAANLKGEAEGGRGGGRGKPGLNLVVDQDPKPGKKAQPGATVKLKLFP